MGLATSYFCDLFTSFDRGDSDRVLNSVEYRIINDMNHQLLRLSQSRRFVMQLMVWLRCVPQVLMDFQPCSIRSFGIVETFLFGKTNRTRTIV